MKRAPNAYWWMRQKREAWRKIKSFRAYFDFRKQVGPVFVDPLNTYVERKIEIGDGTVIEPNVWIMGQTVIGKNCYIGFGSVIIDSVLEDNVLVAGGRIEYSDIGHHAEIGYTAQLKRTKFGAYSKMLHHGYLGDAEVGEHVNIGAGVITANYDGSPLKRRTIIGNNAFIGTNVCLVAPVTVPEGTMVAAGSTVTGKDEMRPYSLIVARAKAHLSRSKRVAKDRKGWRLEKWEEDSQ